MVTRIAALLVGTLLAMGCAAPPVADDTSGDEAAQTSTPVGADEPIARADIPEAQAFLGWTDDETLVSTPKPSEAKRIGVACSDQHLYPTHPAADRKTYHRASYGRYDHFKVNGESSVCKVPLRTRDANGVLRCASADSLHYLVLSDTYEDACGNFYRGFWAVSFLQADETMGTLMSMGRVVYPVPNAQFEGEVYDAQTRAVDMSELLFVSPLRDGDKAAIEKARKSVVDAKTHRYDATTHVWQYIGPNR